MFRPLMLLAISLFAVVACAKPSESETASTKSVDKAELRAKVANVINPNITLGEFKESELAGFYYVSIGGTRGLYVSKDGQHIVDGSVFLIEDDRLVDLGELRAAEQRKEYVAQIDRDSEIVFSPKGEVKGVVHVFTDVDCGYCQKLHQEMAAYHEAGIEVRYLAYPRAGIGSSSYRKVASAWCAADQNHAMDQLKRRAPIPDNVCDENPVAQHFALGGQLGVSGTPAILLEDGRLLPGYRPAEALAREMGI